LGDRTFLKRLGHARRVADRAEAYRRKLNVLAEELAGFPDSVKNLNGLERRGVLHAVQVAADAAMDLAAMAVRDRAREVQDDYHNLDALAELGVVSEHLAAQLKSLNGLRNAIVHKYNRFEERAVLDNLERIGAILQEFAERMEAFA
jgi:uncharacterized protein YutE (UPF0331/DUF86 family)